MAADTVQIVTTALAVLGAVLGLYNAWRNWVQDRMRLRVDVSFGQFTGGGDFVLLSCVNLSTFPVTITHIGFDQVGRSGQHAQVFAPQFIDQEHRLPVRLEPRTSTTAAIALAAIGPDQLVRWRCAYVLTACGVKRTSSARKFRRLKAAIAPQCSPGAGDSVE